MTTDPGIAPFRLTICGLDEIPDHGDRAVSHVISILNPDHPRVDGFDAYPDHHRVELRFDDVVFEREDWIAPTERDVMAILAHGDRLARERASHVLVHCHAGVSRSTATAAILLAQRRPGREVEILDHVNALRPRSWPNSLMVRMGDDLLGLEGRLVAALAGHHARVARAFPDFAEVLRRGHRAHEVPDIDTL